MGYTLEVQATTEEVKKKTLAILDEIGTTEERKFHAAFIFYLAWMAEQQEGNK